MRAAPRAVLRQEWQRGLMDHETMQRAANVQPCGRAASEQQPYAAPPYTMGGYEARLTTVTATVPT